MASALKGLRSGESDQRCLSFLPHVMSSDDSAAEGCDATAFSALEGQRSGEECVKSPESPPLALELKLEAPQRGLWYRGFGIRGKRPAVAQHNFASASPKMITIQVLQQYTR